MKKVVMLVLVLMVWSIGVVAHGEETFAAAEEIIEAKIACEDLTEEQLEDLGDYYMEHMHPGEAHEVMDERMGGDGSDALKVVHINMARNFYCGEHEAMSSSMMQTMMSGGMKGSLDTKKKGGIHMGYGMMGSGMMGSGIGMTLYSLVYVALAAFVFGVMFWWTKKLMLGNKHK